MSKDFLFKLLVSLIILAAPVLWVLSLTMPEFSWFNLSYAVAMVSFGVGVLLILKGLFNKNSVVYKKMNIWLGLGLLIVTLLCIASAIALPENLIVPIIAVIVAAGFVLGILATGGKKWDTADNQKVGYKNYHQRKAEEEKNNKN